MRKQDCVLIALNLVSWFAKVDSNTIKSQIASDLLVFVVGISGSGKDTIMRKASDNLFIEEIPVNILRRDITRSPDKTEESLYVSEEEFLIKKSREEYALSWYVYNNWYGCPRTLLEVPLQRGEVVLVNVSRNILSEARDKYPESKIVLIDVPINIAEKRIKTRGRETDYLLNERQIRMHAKIDMLPPDKVVQNDSDLEKAVNELTDYLKTLYLNFKQKKGSDQ
ncbi:MAG: hypothetical protein JSU57_06035 [Candidatus Heimdallarchaeota archaeon]|nr:MAG: hypothetical protein JSU57_06035 [Candidatus Heimdallarchaeota archaeon]